MSGIERGNTGIPKAIIHQQVLDVAAANPDASHEELATQISGASPNLVKRVLETYGDPAEDQMNETASASESSHTSDVPATNGPENSDDPDQTELSIGAEDSQDRQEASDGGAGKESNQSTYSTSSDCPDEPGQRSMESAEEETNNQTAQSETVNSDPKSAKRAEPAAETSLESAQEELPAVSDLTEKQRQTLRAVRANPTATQAEIASDFDVTPATISAHVNAVAGFEWSERAAFVNLLFDDEPTPETVNPEDSEKEEDQPTMSSQHAENRLDEIEARLTKISDRLEATEGTTGPLSAELTHKVIHACMESEQITTDEELQIIQSILK